MAIESYRDHTPRLGRDVYIHPTATVIGDVELGDEASVWPHVVIRGDVNRIRVGDRSVSVQPPHLYPANGIRYQAYP